MMVCMSCGVKMELLKIGVPAMPVGKVGPYEIYSADLYGCPKCGASVLSDFGSQPYGKYDDRDEAFRKTEDAGGITFIDK